MNGEMSQYFLVLIAEDYHMYYLIGYPKDYQIGYHCGLPVAFSRRLYICAEH